MNFPAKRAESPAECRALFAFDVAQAIDLEGAARALRDPSRAGTLGRTHPAPSHFQFAPPPLRVSQRGPSLPLERWSTSETIEVVVFDFGAVLVSYSIAHGASLEECVELSAALAADESLSAAARERASELLAALGEHATRPGLARASEDYLVFVLAGARVGGEAERFLSEHGATLAGVLRGERQPLSREVVADALAIRMQYGPDDLALVDWHAALVFDDDPEDFVRVLEYANVQLLEMRFLDSQLDAALEASMQAVSRRDSRRFLGPLGLRRELSDLAAMQLEAAYLFERLGNTLKVSGDQYLARVLRQSGARFRIQEWNDAAQRKLAALDNVYDKLHDHASTLRAELLEFLIVLLIVFEIVLSLFGS